LSPVLKILIFFIFAAVETYFIMMVVVCSGLIMIALSLLIIPWIRSRRK